MNKPLKSGPPLRQNGACTPTRTLPAHVLVSLQPPTTARVDALRRPALVGQGAATDGLADRAGFEDAYLRHAARAYAAARAVVDHATAEDVTQEVFATLWARPEAYDASRGPLGAYVALMARSRAVDRWRSAAAGSAAVDRLAERGDHLGHGEDPADVVHAREGLRLVLDALRSRPAPQREAVVLSHLGGLTHDEIAAKTAVPVGTVKSRVRLGLHGAAATLAA